MNVEDTTAPEQTGDMLAMVFSRQVELHKKYQIIENQAGLGLGLMDKEAGFSIDNQRCQEVCKNYAWRVTEELTESTEAFASAILLNDEVMLHVKEEAMDALHFMVELLIITGHGAADMVPENISQDHLVYLFSTMKYAPTKNHRTHAYNTIEYLGIAMNCLKQKPWKQHHVFTDTRRFRYNLRNAFEALIGYCACIGMDAASTYDLYFRKSEVNKFRIGSNY
jgi:hypothetical protein